MQPFISRTTHVRCLAGATFGLYAHEDILDPADDSVLYAKDSLIPDTTKKTDANGKLTFKADLPIPLDDEVHFYVKKIEALIGYATTDEMNITVFQPKT